MSKTLYSFFIAALQFGVRISAISSAKSKNLLEGQKGLIEKIEEDFRDRQNKSIWFHCASLGEFEQGRPLIETIKKQYPNEEIVLTFFSPSGYEVRKDYPGADFVYYLPFDTKENAERFIAAIHPKLAVFVKYEFWFHYLNTLHTKGIKTILISAIFQKRQPFFKWYGSLHRKMLHFFDCLFVQDEQSVALLKSIGIKNFKIAGDTRLDRVIAIASEERRLDDIMAFKGQNKLFIAGSTWLEDETLLKNALPILPADIKLLIAPHDINESHLSQIESLFEGIICRLSSQTKTTESRICIADSMGQLAYMYRYADYIWIGGGFNKTGIHNSLEAAVYGKPMLWGPNFDRYQEAKELLEIGAAFSVSNAPAMAEKIKEWHRNDKAYSSASQAALKYIARNRGATTLIMNYLKTENVFLQRPGNS